jgi:hypothetical protein
MERERFAHLRLHAVTVGDVSFVAASTTATNVATIPVGAATGDLLVAFAFRDGTATAPTGPGAKWAAIQSGGANLCAQWCGWRIWDGVADQLTFTNATSAAVAAYRGHDPAGPIGISAQAGAATANIAAPAAGTFAAIDKSSWGASLYGHRTQAAFTPGFGVERVDYADGTNEQLGICDSGIWVGAWPGGTVTHAGSSGWRAVSLEIRRAATTGQATTAAGLTKGDELCWTDGGGKPVVKYRVVSAVDNAGVVTTSYELVATGQIIDGAQDANLAVYVHR